MFEGHRVVCVTPAGRRRYLRILAPQILASPLVDEYRLWRNTVDPADNSYLDELRRADRRVQIDEPSLLPPGEPAAIRQFYPRCTEAGTIYVRFDDDIVFVEPGFFEKFLTFRLEQPQYFVVFPQIVNNAVCTYVQAMRGAIAPGAVLHPWCMDVNAWGNPRFAEQLHRAFLSAVEAGDLSNWYFGPQLMALSRFSINCMAWLGETFATFGGEVLGDEEEYVSVIKPTALQATNCIYGNVIVAHFAFRPQRVYLDATDLLQRYADVGRTRSVAAPRARMTPLEPINLWTPRLMAAIDRLSTAAWEDLQKPDVIADVIRHAGLILDWRFPYGSDNRYMNTERAGVWHVPMQLARCLVTLSAYRITSVLDIGTASGWTIALVTAYLARFNPNLQVTTIDVHDYFESYPQVKARLPISFGCGTTSKQLTATAWDLIIMDAEQSYLGCAADYDAVGDRAPLCLMHDIQDRYVASSATNDGGVPRFWRELKSRVGPPDAAIEFLDHPNHEQIMGLGLIVRATATPLRETADVA